MKQVFCFSSLALLLAAMFGVAMAQSGSPPQGFTAQPVPPGEIQTGYVIAYGQLVPPPYRVLAVGEAIMINDQTYEPRPVDPALASIQPSTPDADAIQKHDLLLRVSRRWAELRNLSGATVTPELLSEFEHEQLLGALEFKDNELLLTYSEGNTVHISVDSRNADSNPEARAASREQQRAVMAMTLQELLRNQGIIAYGYDYTLLIPQPDAADIIRTIQASVRGQQNPESVHEQISRLTSSVELADDIIGHANEWR